ncbi:MAG: tRNA (adenosine(37)-N6)-threonylcarbamoyltransferase complex dimerization subunit type 1 TsaB [Terriglobia bacterium]
MALDTTSDWGGAAIFRDAECLATSAQQGFTNYSVSLFQAVNDALEKARLRLSEIDLYAAANGPGSFTGIRVGLAAVQGWAQAFDKPAYGVSVLEAMAEEAQAQTRFALSLLDARRGEFYARLFHRTVPVSRLTPQREGAILKPENIAPFIQSHAPPGEGCTLAARENDPQACALAQSLLASLPWKTVSGFLFSAIARVALYEAQAERSVLPQDLSAYYIRRPDAEINWKP